ncbi:MAG: tetratricopeptide repeat protein, partial [Nitrospinota bacterium]|nr:tetratricopeptide repeat protein [Nitrospinota bacterium]
VLEAKSLYEAGLKRSPKGLYSQFRRTRLALLMLREDRFEEAYDKLQSLLKVSPKDEQAQEGIFKIAKWYHDQENFTRSLEIYEEAIQLWPEYLDAHAEVNFFMGEMYFNAGNFPKARKHYFDLINLNPETSEAFKSLNRIGDTYFMEGNDQAALAVFDESSKRKSAGREALYGMIRLADIGVRNPELPVRDIVFDVEPYFHPFQTYQKVLKKAENDEGIAAQVLLSRGIAYLREQRHLNAMDQFKQMLALNPEKRLTQQGQKFAQQTLYLMVDKFFRQKGYLPILYAYADYLGLNLGDVNNVKAIVQIGESYQAIGMIQEAVNHYDRAKKLDSSDTFSDRIFLNLGRIHLEEEKFNDSERVARVFLNKFHRGNLIPEGMKLLAASLVGQKKFDEAIATYKNILERKPKDPSEIHYLLGEVYYKLGRQTDAIQAYKRVKESFDRSAKSQPEYVSQAFFKHGITLYENNKFSEAVQVLGKAKQLYPDHPLGEWAAFLIAEGHDQLKEPQQARAELTELAKSAQADDVLKQAAESKIKLMDWEKQFKGLL